MLALKNESFRQADKWLELAIEAQRQQGKGKETLTFKPMAQLQSIITAQKDNVCRNALFNLTKLRQTHDLRMNTVFPPD